MNLLTSHNVLSIIFLLLILFPVTAYSENIDPDSNDSQYAYGENVGWINLEPGGDGGSGVEVTDTALTGYAWGENIGWINFGPTKGGVTNDGNGNLSGYAWGENVGWINFAPSGGGVTIDPDSGVFSGYAYGENIGWINFAPSGKQIKTSWKPSYKVWYVKTDGTDTSDCSGGKRWGTAFQSIHKAVYCASSGDEIWVKQGTYYVNNYIWVNKDVRIYGGFFGNESQKSLRKWWQYKTKVDGQAKTLCFDVSASTTIDGFTITNCSGDYGGGMMIVTPNGSSTVTAIVSNCIFSKNKATTAGGAIYIESATPTLTNCLLTENSAVYYGGAVMNYQSSSKIMNCTLSKNSAYYGGAIYNSNSSPALTLTNSILWEDSATNGKEIYYDTFSPVVTYCDIDQDGYAGNNNIREDPSFTSDVYLNVGSPCIDKGNNTISGIPQKDLDGNTRIVDGDTDGIAVVDLGVYEYQTGVSPTIDVPTSQQTFTSSPAVNPVKSSDPQKAVPIGLGSVAEGGDNMSLQVGLSQFSGPVDMYLAIYAPVIDPEHIYFITSDPYQPISVGITPWKANVTEPVDESLFGDIPTSALPLGTYYFGIMITPAGNMESYYIWTTSFVTQADHIPIVSNLTIPSSACVDEEFRIQYDYSDPDGLANVKEHHIEMSDGWEGVYFTEGKGTGHFDVGGFYFETPGSHWVKVYVADFEGHQSNVLQANISIVICK